LTGLAGYAILASYGTTDIPDLHNNQAVNLYTPDFLDYTGKYGIIVAPSLEGVITCIHNKEINMIRKFGAKQLKEITKTDKKVLVSYETPVAVRFGDDLFVTNYRFSNTTSKHISLYLREMPSTVVVNRVDQSVIEKLSK
jgi:hypothetical protein